MLRTHRTSEGETLLICEMDDTHLVNTIRQKCARIQRLLSTSRTPRADLSPAMQHLYRGTEIIDPVESAKRAASEIEKLESYLAEALLRKNVADEVRPMARAALGRTGEEGAVGLNISIDPPRLGTSSMES